MKNHLFLLCLTVFWGGGCQYFRPVQYKIAVGDETGSYYKIGTQLIAVLNHGDEKTFGLDTHGEGSTNNCERVLVESADFALAQNDVETDSPNDNLRSVLPLYSEVLFIVYHDSIHPKSLKDLIVGRKIGIGSKTGGTLTFAKHLFSSYGIAPDTYKFVYSSSKENTLSDSVLVSIHVTAHNNPIIKDMLVNKQGKLFSLDDEATRKGSSAEGFCMEYPLARPYVIPKELFFNLPRQPVLTIAIDNILFADVAIPNHVVYDVVDRVLSSKAKLAKENSVFRYLNDDFEDLLTRFPLHQGVKNYLRRNKPGFFQRNSSLLKGVASLLTAILGIFSIVKRWQTRRKKARIEEYYNELAAFDQEILQQESLESLIEVSKKARLLRDQVIYLVGQNQLEANQSLQIFLLFWREVNENVQHKTKHLKALQK
ncbi:TAXI family TRAP transporter solute-binding subunit [uncultured Microscilla sp.]|uniref:TAXI family TRAP transporter solute-binding subunit n=1 Tax=uncultured Microscilla sp. TaxID=432653 RepID=UPI00260EB468|nr:TAXI family TRAP transporter solute-binding subunit [uncultured Microscilla sp.]